MTNSWPLVALVDVCESVVDCVNKTAPLADGETPFKMLRTTNVRNGFVDTLNCRFVTREVYEKWTRRQIPMRGDVILTREAPLGEVGMLRDDETVFLGQRLMAYRADPSKLDKDFLLYNLMGPELQAQIRAAGSGSTVEHIRVPDAERLKIRLPRLSTQQKIGRLLASYDELYLNNQRRIAILEEIARRLFDEWFVRFRYPGHEAVRLVETALGMVPEGWKLGTVQDIVVLQRGFDLPNTKRSDGPFPVVAATGEHGVHSEAKVRGPGIVTGRSGSLGKVMHISGDFWPLNTTLWGKEYPLGSTYFAYFTISNLPFGTLNAGAAVPSLNRNHVHLLPTVVPSPDAVELFDKSVAPMFALQRSLLDSNVHLRAARDLLLPKLLSGEISVGQAEEAFEEAAE